MKTNRNARLIRKARTVLFFLVVATIAFLEISYGDALAARLAQKACARSEISPASALNMGDLMASVR